MNYFFSLICKPFEEYREAKKARSLEHALRQFAKHRGLENVEETRPEFQFKAVLRKLNNYAPSLLGGIRIVRKIAGEFAHVLPIWLKWKHAYTLEALKNMQKFWDECVADIRQVMPPNVLEATIRRKNVTQLFTMKIKIDKHWEAPR